MTVPTKTHNTATLRYQAVDHEPLLFMVMTGDGPLLVLTLGGNDADTILRNGMRLRGYGKFMAWPLPPDEVRAAYGTSFEVIEKGLRGDQPMRVLDFDGARVFENIVFAQLGSPLPFDV